MVRSPGQQFKRAVALEDVALHGSAIRSGYAPV